MNAVVPIERVIDLIDPAQNVLLNMTYDEALERVRSGDQERVSEIDGQFSILARDGKRIRLARSIGRPMRYFLAKRAEGPCLIVAERMDAIHRVLADEGLADQFHPSYTRMVPAHHLLELHLVGCPDPNPQLKRFFDPQSNQLPADINEIGKRYIQQLHDDCERWLLSIPSDEPIGVLFSGGVDSGAVFLTLYRLILNHGMNPGRLKAFTLSVGGEGSDQSQARQFLKQLDLEMFLEVLAVEASDIDWREAVRVVEDYKPLDIQAATMGLAACKEIRRRYSDWQWLVDGDGGDENLKDYPIEENPELTIRSVLNNQMLYQEGWGVDAIKHSLTHSGGQSRGHVRSFAPANSCGFRGFSPFALPSVIQVAEGIPFIELTDWDHEKLYQLKGQIAQAGVRSVLDFEMPIFQKQRFQHGVTTEERFDAVFPRDEGPYREEYGRLFSAS